MHLPPPDRLPKEFWEPLPLLDKVHVYWITANRLMRRWSRSIPTSIHFSTEVGLLSFLLLSIMPLHPLSIIATFGGAISLVFASLLLDFVMRRLLALFRTYQVSDSSPSEELPFQRFAVISRWATFPIVALVARDPRLVALPFFLLTATMAVCMALILYTLFRRVAIDERSYKNNMLAIAVCILFASLLNLVPSQTGLASSVAIVTAGVFLVFYTICWLLSLSKLTLNALTSPSAID